MSELDLFKFIQEHSLEYHWNDGDVILFIPHYITGEWMKLLGWYILDDEGIECNMKDGYFCFMMQEICNYFGIEMENVFSKEE